MKFFNLWAFRVVFLGKSVPAASIGERLSGDVMVVTIRNVGK